MKRKLASFVLCLSLLGLSANGAPVALAQEGTPEPTSAPVTVIETPSDQPVVVEDSGTTVVNEDEANPLAPLLLMASAVFAAMELLKNLFLSDLTKELTERQRAAVNWLVASALALILMLGTSEGMDIFTLTGFPSPFPDIVARIVTALAIGGGNAVLHEVYEFLRSARGVSPNPPTVSRRS